MTYDPSAAKQSDLTTLTNNLKPMYMALTDKTVTNTTTETTAFSSSFMGAGLTLPANRAAQSTTIQIRGTGYYSVPLVTPGTLTYKVKVGGSTLATVTANTLIAGITNAAFDVNIDLVFRTVGTSGTLAVMGGSNFSATLGASRAFLDIVTTSDATVNTTIDNAIDVTLQWSLASASRTITVRGATVSLVN